MHAADGFVAIRDIAPKAPTHLLILPEHHIDTFRDVCELEAGEAKRMVEVEEIGDSVRARILVETESQKGILIGKRGAMIREIGTRSRPEVEALVGHPVFLELVVKVRPRWRRDRKSLERLGL